MLLDFVLFIAYFTFSIFIALLAMHELAIDEKNKSVILAFSFVFSVLIWIIGFDSSENHRKEREILAKECESKIEFIKEDLRDAENQEEETKQRISDYCYEVIALKKRPTEEDEKLCKSAW